MEPNKRRDWISDIVHIGTSYVCFLCGFIFCCLLLHFGCPWIHQAIAGEEMHAMKIAMCLIVCLCSCLYAAVVLDGRHH